MNIHEHRVSITAASGSAASSTLNIRGGILRQMLVRANTATTTFAVNLVDENSLTRGNWGFHEGELNDVSTKIPMRGTYTINITNASLDDTFNVLLGIQE